MRVNIVLGTRPEIVKFAPIIKELRARGAQTRVIHTGQHTTLAEDLYRYFDIKVDLDLNVMLEKPNLVHLTQRIISRLEDANVADADWVLVQGDTTSAFAGAYWGFCHQIPVGHVEAGLRTYDLASPFPEEGNRQLISKVTSKHFAPTAQSALNLVREGVAREGIELVGNTSIDALQYALEQIGAGKVSFADRLDPMIENFLIGAKVALVTAHRRENMGQPIQDICAAILELAKLRPDLRFVLPVHPNPNIRKPILEALDRHPQVLCCEPLGYLAFAQMMNRADIILTDSGGVQEEAPSLRKPILVLRETTERPEGVDAGFAKLLGHDKELIVKEALRALELGCTTDQVNPYGDGLAAKRIVDSLLEGKSETFQLPLAPEVATSEATLTLQ